MSSQNKPIWIVPWLKCRSLMTGKLQADLQSGSGSVQLKRIAETWTGVGWWERYMLGLEAGRMFQREITIAAGNDLCWYARTLVPELCYSAHESIFSRLQNESLGDILFSDARINRAGLKIYSIDAMAIEYYWLNQAWREDATCFWVRLSHFIIAEEPLHSFFLSEILLPGLGRATGNSNL